MSILFYKDIYDAIERAIVISGKSRKEIASVVYPKRRPETARSLLSRALTPENTDVHLSIEMLLAIIKETRPDDFIFYLCDEFGFERPSKKDKTTFEKEVKCQMKTIQEQINSLVRELKNMETFK